jgi:hypothetical protein
MLMQSVIRKSWFLCSKWKKSKQSTWMGWGRIVLLRKEESPLLPGDETEEAEGTVGCRWREPTFLFQVLLKPILLHGRAGPGGSHPIMNEWVGTWAVPSQMRVVWPIPRHPTWAPLFSYQPASNLPGWSTGKRICKENNTWRITKEYVMNITFILQVSYRVQSLLFPEELVMKCQIAMNNVLRSLDFILGNGKPRKDFIRECDTITCFLEQLLYQ